MPQTELFSLKYYPQVIQLLHCDIFNMFSVSGGYKKKRTPVQYRSVISDVFDGRILSSVQCLTCERVSGILGVT